MNDPKTPWNPGGMRPQPQGEQKYVCSVCNHEASITNHGKCFRCTSPNVDEIEREPNSPERRG